MSPRRLLLLDATHLTVFRWAKGNLDQEVAFSTESDGVAAFSQYLSEHRDTLFLFVADIADEGFQIEEIPYVQGRDRKALIRRRLGQYFYTTPYVTALSFGRAKSGRRDEKLLFAGITGALHLEPWMTALREASVQLVGLYSAPLLVAAFHDSRKSGASRELIITIGQAGVRQTFFENGQFRLSRLTPLTSKTTAECANLCMIEAQKLYQYLVSQRMIERGSRLAVTVLAGAPQISAIRDRSNSLDEFQLTFESLEEVNRKAGLKSYPGEIQADALLLQIAVNNPPAEQFAPDADRQGYRLWQIRSAINAIGILGFIACLLLAVKLGLDVYMVHERTGDTLAQVEADSRRYEAMMATLPPLPVKADELKRIVGRYDDIKRKSPSLGASLSRISRALEAAPSVELKSLDWTLAATPDEVTGPGSPAPSGIQYVVIRLDAVLPLAMANDHRGMIESVDRFIRALKAQPDTDVRLTKQPFETESGKTIRSSKEGTSAEVDAPAFSVRIAQRIP